ncbi:MAG TPA: hypothetical protein VGJ61_10735 [Solirubrobacterales bacterium]|jgi:ketosteroid isomerase-like protein
MSEAEVDVVRRAGEAYTERGIESFLEFLNPEVEWRSRADLPDTDLYTGHDGVSGGKIIKVDEFADKQKALEAVESE